MAQTLQLFRDPNAGPAEMSLRAAAATQQMFHVYDPSLGLRLPVTAEKSPVGQVGSLELAERTRASWWWRW